MLVFALTLASAALAAATPPPPPSTIYTPNNTTDPLLQASRTDISATYVSHSQQPVLRGKEGVGRTGNYVDLAICIASFLGSLTIILPYVLNRAHRKLRHALILGLATSDLISSAVIIISTSYLITHDHADMGDTRSVGFSQAPVLCDLLGFITASSIFTQHLWNLAIATVTYSILVFPLATFTITIERRIKWLWPIFWFVAAIMHAVIWGVIGYTDIGGYCQIAPTKGGLTAPLIQFVPRSLVVVTTIILYAHLFIFLRRTNLFSKAHRSSASASRGTGHGALSSIRPGSAIHGTGTGTGKCAGQGSKGGVEFSNNATTQQGILSALNSVRGGSSINHGGGGTDQGSVGRRPSHVTGTSTVGETIPELPCYTVKASNSPDAAGVSGSDSSVSLESSSQIGDEEEDVEAGEATGDTLYERRRKRREREASMSPRSFGVIPVSNSTMTASSTMSSDLGPGGPGAPPVLRALSLQAGLVAERISRPRSSGNPNGTSNQPTTFNAPRWGDEWTPSQQQQQRNAADSGIARTEGEVEAGDATLESDNESEADSILQLRATMAPRRDVVDFQMNSPPQEHLSHFTGGVMQVRGLGAQVFKSRISRAVSTGAMQHSAPLPYIQSPSQAQHQQPQPPHTGIWPAGATFNPWAVEGEVRPSTGGALGSGGNGNGGLSTPSAAAFRRGSSPVNGSPRLMSGATPWSAPLPASSGAPSYPLQLGTVQQYQQQQQEQGGPIAIAPTIAANTVEANRQRRRKASEAAKRRIAVGLDVEEGFVADSSNEPLQSRSRHGSSAGVGGRGWGNLGTPESCEASLTVMEEFEAAMGDFQWGMDVTQLSGSSTLDGSRGLSPTSGTQHGFKSSLHGGFAGSWIGKVAASVRRMSDANHSDGNGGGGRGGHGAGVTTHNSAHSSASIKSGACVESVGSTLNRQASILMLLYPTAYVCLFSVSIIRIVVDLADPVPVGGMERRTQRGLHSVARWFIFAQGVFDAVIFQLVERHFRSRMKRRRKVEMGEPVPLTAWQMLKVWTRTLIFGHGPRK
ncbi:hypothetical protein CF319_g672 [Tilletia indica]|nr:hypothetical protein CF319_g672 [Tilletia indica]